jgi:hypothetical protein
MPPTTGPRALRRLLPSRPDAPIPRALRRAKRLPVLPSANSCVGCGEDNVQRGKFRGIPLHMMQNRSRKYDILRYNAQHACLPSAGSCVGKVGKCTGVQSQALWYQLMCVSVCFVKGGNALTAHHPNREHTTPIDSKPPPMAAHLPHWQHSCDAASTPSTPPR